MDRLTLTHPRYFQIVYASRHFQNYFPAKPLTAPASLKQNKLLNIMRNRLHFSEKSIIPVFKECINDLLRAIGLSSVLISLQQHSNHNSVKAILRFFSKQLDTS